MSLDSCMHLRIFTNMYKHIYIYTMLNVCLLFASTVLLVNYDMQWTAIRYIQQCENYRKDLITINLSMMTYEWFKHKHKFYPTLKFPGEIYSNKYVPNTKKNLKKSKKNRKNKLDNTAENIVAQPDFKETFTLFEFVSMNPNIDIFLSGKLGYEDINLNNLNSFIPVGLVRQIRPKNEAENATIYGIHGYMFVPFSIFM
jgi:hypothetical protein